MNYRVIIQSIIPSVLMIIILVDLGLPFEYTTYNRSFIADNGSIIFIPDNITFNDFRGEPSYTLGIKANNLKLDPGDTLKLGLIVSGAGDIDFCKISVSIPPYIVDRSVRLKSVDYVINKTYGYSITNINTQYVTPTFTVRIADYLFRPQNYRAIQNVGEMIFTESNDNPVYPINIEFKIPNNVSRGDHDINVCLFYKNKDKWYCDRQVITAHINKWYEDERWPILIYAVALLEMIRAIPEVVKTNLKRRLLKMTKKIRSYQGNQDSK